jgi:hypothetical protein
MEINREDKLLINILREDGASAGSIDFKSLTKLEWDSVIQQSIRHSVSALFYRRLKKLSSEAPIPDDVLKRLHEEYLQSVARNIRLYHELSKRLKILADDNIQVIVLKGAHLGEIVYGSIGLRTMADVDLLFRKEDLARAQKRLMAAGYSSIDKQFAIDFHWNIDLTIANLDIDTEGMWERAQPTAIAGVNVLALSPEDLLLHLCTHLAFHHHFGFAGLRALCDVRETINHYHDQIDWGEIQRRAVRWGAGNSVYLTLSLAREFLGVQAPKGFIAALKPEGSDSRAREWALERMFGKASNMLPGSPYFWQLFMPMPLREKAATFLRLIVPPREFISQKYPTYFGSRKNYLYYLVRFIEKSLRYGKIIWGVIVRDQEILSIIRQEKKDIAMRGWLLSG